MESPKGTASKQPEGAFESRKIAKRNSWGRAIVLTKSGDVDIRKKRDVEKNAGPEYQRLKLPRRKRTVSLFIDQDDDGKLITEEESSPDDRFLGKLILDRLGLVNQALFLLGHLRTLYVAAATNYAASYSSDCESRCASTANEDR
ncbi:uncharacterized protein EI97DRAFT_463786 [Westerdykella ornata]|uniref:Uncharacterized protein n=1 Tax=Westerdykella ornata TaxID=318751 RepID=A0A6A6JXW1_WESOR|nr:uncharacterized protein EI97DRAFT_463786 [Westerdykella ornata]KAF2281460.1 hypothetical protein EI97DRAFT_463786 [Westerdykella ornata]